MLKRFQNYSGHLQPVKKQFVWGILFGVVAAAANGFGLAFMIDRVFPVIFPDESGALKSAPGWLIAMVRLVVGADRVEEFILLAACAMLPLVFVVRGICSFCSSYLINLTGMRVLESVRVALFRKLQHLPLAFHQKHREGDLVSRVLNDTNQLQAVMVAVSANLILQPVTLFFAVGFLVFKSVENTNVLFIIIVLISVPLCVLPVRAIGRKLLLKARRAQENMGDLTAAVSENLASQQELRSFNQEEAQLKRFSGLTDLLVRSMLKVTKYRLLTPPIIEALSALGIGFAIFFGAKQNMQLAEFVPLIVAFYMSYAPIKILGRMQNQIRQGEASLDRIEEVLNEEDSLEDAAEPKSFSEVRGEVVFDQVSFAYDELLALRDIDVRIKPGEKVALVGESGAGKTTFAALISRFYGVSEGAIRIDGLDVGDVARRELRERIALVSQQPILFRASVRENILIGRPDASEEEVVEAARNAFADQFIREMPKGYDTELGDRGDGLSGGQRQRVAIARAFLKDAPILILDEATSALDTESEAQVQEALARLSEGRTTIMIAHRFSSIRHADRILVFEKTDRGGVITGDAHHDQLMETHEGYRTLYTRQTAWKDAENP